MDEADLMAVEACNLSGYKQEGGDGEKVKKDNVEKFKRTIGWQRPTAATETGPKMPKHAESLPHHLASNDHELSCQQNP